MSEITTIVDEKLPMQLDSISWNKKHDILAVGAYMINPDDSAQRIGKIFLMQLQLENKEGDDTSMHMLDEVGLSGVLDLRWEPQQETKLAVATSSSLELYELDFGTEKKHLYHISSLPLESMALYTQWMDVEKLVFSDSNGFINIVATNPLALSDSKKVHDNLTWVVQYNAHRNIIFAGSDEGKFTGFLLENMDDEEKHYEKKFEVGVTSIIFLENNILAVGSYDDTLRLFTIDHLDPISLSLKKKIQFGGAVWRTIRVPSALEENESNFVIVAACARNGIHLIHVNSSWWAYDTIMSCMDHEGFLAYGLDVKFNHESKTYTIASCYFDNQQLHIWKCRPQMTAV